MSEKKKTIEPIRYNLCKHIAKTVIGQVKQQGATDEELLHILEYAKQEANGDKVLESKGGECWQK